MALPRKPGFPLNPFGQQMRRGPMPRQAPPDQYQELQASLLYCPTCKQATPTRERLLLVLPGGDLYEYRCARCGTSTGSKTKHA